MTALAQPNRMLFLVLALFGLDITVACAPAAHAAVALPAHIGTGRCLSRAQA